MSSRLPVLAALTALFSGCSFIFGGGPPAEHQQMPYFDCPSTAGLPVADGVVATFAALGAASTLAVSKEEFARRNNGEGSRNGSAGTLIAAGAVFAASAVYGIVQAQRCSAAKEALKARILTPMVAPPVRPAQPALPPPPPLPVPPASPASPTETAPPPAAAPTP